MESPLSIGLRSARALVVPAAVLLSFGTAVVVAFYRVPAVHDALDVIARLKSDFGYAFAPLTTMALGGLVPWVFRMAMPALRPARPLAELLFGLGWWAFMGVVIDAFYRLLSVLFDGTGWPVAVIVLAKVLCDMLVFTPVLASPGNALAHLWKELGFSFVALRRALGAGCYQRLVLPNLIPNFMLWFPGVTLVYSLPQPLQLPMSNLIGCFWALMCVQIAANSRGRVSVVAESVA